MNTEENAPEYAVTKTSRSLASDRPGAISKRNDYFSKISILCTLLILCTQMVGMGPLGIFIVPAGATETTRNYQVEKKAYDLLTAANALEESKQFDQALGLLHQATRYDPTSYSCHIHASIAHAYLQKKNYAKSLEECKKAKTFDSKDSFVAWIEAQTYLRSGNVDGGLASLNSYLNSGLSPSEQSSTKTLIKELTAHKYLKESEALTNSSRFNEALAKLKLAAAQDPTAYSASIHSVLTHLYARLGRSKESIREGEKALALDPGSTSTIYNVALSYGDLAEFSKAIELMERFNSLETNPDWKRRGKEAIAEFKRDKDEFDYSGNKLPDYMDCQKKNGRTSTWNNKRMPLSVYVPQNTKSLGYSKSYDSFVTDSLDTWCLASGKKISYKLVKSPERADIVVEWQDSSLGLEPNRKIRKAGLTALNSTGNNIDHAVVKIMTVDPFDTSNPSAPEHCAAVCMHEIGHALGLSHSKLIKDLMYYRGAAVQTGRPTARDKKTLACLYASHPVVSFTPITSPADKQKIEYEPPPMFQPPPPPGIKRLAPPLYLPPPRSSKKELRPPMFTPPLKEKKIESTKNGDGHPVKAPPMFTPPALPPEKRAEKVRSQQQHNKKRSKNPQPPLFMPKPAK